MAQSSALLLAGTGMAIPTLFSAHEGSDVDLLVQSSQELGYRQVTWENEVGICFEDYIIVLKIRWV